MLWVILQFTNLLSNKPENPQRRSCKDYIPSALALFSYAAGFSFAYISLSTATGALLLFGAVQVTMIFHGLRSGERLGKRQVLGVTLAFGGLVGLLIPGVSAPPLLGSLLMLGAGMAWGVYSIIGKRSLSPIRDTAVNFSFAVVLGLVLSLLTMGGFRWSPRGAVFALLSGALTSGMGYALWYAALPSIKTTSAAVVQLSVPVIAALGGVILLREALDLRIVLTGMAILGGIGMMIWQSKPSTRG